MFIGPMNGYGIENAAATLPVYGLYLQMEWGTVTAAEALLAGHLMAFSSTDNQAQAGIMRETRGLRAILYPQLAVGAVATVRAAGVSLSSVEALPNNATYAATRGPLIVVQSYGPHGAIRADTTADGNIIVNGMFMPTPDAAPGCVSGPPTEGTVSQVEINKAVGFAFEAVAINIVGTFKGFVNCMNITA